MPERLPTKLRIAVISLLLALFAVQAITSLRAKSVTTDEIMYIAAGWYHLSTGRFDFNMTNPAFPKWYAALGLLPLQPDLPAFEGPPGDLSLVEQWHWSRTFMYENRVDADTMLLYARLPVVLLGLVLGGYVFAFAARLYGDRCGVLALFLYALSPNILAHTRLGTLDLPVAAFLFLFVHHFSGYLEKPRYRSLFASGAMLGASVLCKTTGAFALVAAGAVLALLVVRGRGEGIHPGLPFVRRLDPARVRARQLVSYTGAVGCMGLVALLTLDAGYFGRELFEPFVEDRDHSAIFARLPVDTPLVRDVTTRLLELPVPWPKAFSEVVKAQASLVSTGNTLYLAGETSREGWWYLMPFAVLVKTPLALFVLLLLGLGAWRAAGRPRTAELLGLANVAIVLLLFSYLRNVAVGLRYVLPIYPFLHVFAARFIERRPAPLTAMAGGLALCWYVYAALAIHPHYLSHFNELVGGPEHGYEYLADSHLDWGQDLKALKAYLDAEQIDRIRLAYFGSGDARYYGIDYEYLPSVGLNPKDGGHWWYEADTAELPAFDPAGGPIAISATLLAGVFYPGYYAALRDLQPIAQVGHSILIFDPDRRIAASGAGGAPHDR